MRVAVGVQYDGCAFRGWQAQSLGIRTVQACLEQALSNIADHPIQVVCAGRTDAGVHALNQIVHFDTTAHRSEQAWVRGGNTHLPADLNINWACQVPDDFHARFSAQSRRYRYLILNQPQRSALWQGRAAWCYRLLDAQRMHRAAQPLIGEHDFSSFRAAECQAHHPVRVLYELTVRRRYRGIIIEVEANAFLHHMVRNIAGVLMAIGAGDQPVSWTKKVLEARDRTQAGITAPAEGLYLLMVHYPEYFRLPIAVETAPLFDGCS
ncbi:MAG: tRNA pseudouridine(38-40) synthase TruA [Candidatus Contendobacter odensis]|uniref:tRNA pseudouridine synthase A n=1 Tax=Candidatus Contendibacter odensensis TaxID=1400860 RepID=A0A2G6PGF8_9GAMM|nr:MAG: tRNA pseudouridine(38-40) synthase TruA [Candidatus Contendobacter odensis]